MKKRLIALLAVVTLMIGITSTSFAFTHNHNWIYKNTTTSQGYHDHCTITPVCAILIESTTIHYFCSSCSETKSVTRNEKFHDNGNCPLAD